MAKYPVKLIKGLKPITDLQRERDKSKEKMMGNQHRSNVAVFFMATLIPWFVAVVFEIGFNRRSDLLGVLGGYCLFQSANWVLRKSFSCDPLFVNMAVSLLHSTITSFAVIFIFIRQWNAAQACSEMFSHRQLVGSAWPGAYTALSLSCGYFASDQWNILQYRLYSGWFPSILVHHLVIVLCFTLALYRNVAINYLILTLICELHSIFLNARKLRRMIGIRRATTNIVKAEWAVNWVTFTFARLIPHILITIKLLTDASKFNKGVELALALFGLLGLNLLNACLGLDLFAAFKREANQPLGSHVN